MEDALHQLTYFLICHYEYIQYISSYYVNMIFGLCQFVTLH